MIDGAGNFGGKPELFERTEIANDEMNSCIALAVATGKGKGKDQYSALAMQAYANEPIEMEHIVSNIKIAIGSGINEPRDAIMTALYGLLTNPDQFDAVARDVNLSATAFEEAVRRVAPIQVSSRRVTEDTEIRGYHIPKGDVVMTIQASANHDEEVYENGHLFNVFRKEKRHQALGNGPHFCMGTHLSRRMIGEVALPRLIERFPGMRLTNPSEVISSGFGFRGPLNLTVVLN